MYFSKLKMILSPNKVYSPLLHMSIYVAICLCFSTGIIGIGGANAVGVGVANFTPGNASKISAPFTTAGTTPDAELSPLLKRLLGNLERGKREIGLPLRGRQKYRLQRKKTTAPCPTGGDTQHICLCYYRRNQTYPPPPENVIYWEKKVCPQYLPTTPTTTSTTTTAPPTTSTPTPTPGNFTCFVCDNGLQKNERCQDGSKHANWDMTTSQRCNTVDEFFTAYDTIRYEFKRRFPHSEKRDAFRSEDDGKMHRPTVHLCVSLAIHPNKKGVDIKVVRGCIYGHNGDIVNGFLSRLTVSPNLDMLGDGGIMGSMPSCRTAEISSEGGMKKVEICACNHGQRCNYNPIAGACLAGPFHQLLLLLLSIFVLSLSTVIQI